MKLYTAIITLALSSASARNDSSFSGAGSMRGRGNKNQDKNEDKDRRSNDHRRLQKEECVLMLKKTIMDDKSEVEKVDCYDKRTNRVVHISGSSGNGDVENTLLSKFNSGMIVSGQSTFMLDSAYYDDEVGSLIVPSLDGAVYGEDAGSRRRKVETAETKDMVAIRITASEKSTTPTSTYCTDYGNWADTCIYMEKQSICCTCSSTLKRFRRACCYCGGGYTCADIASKAKCNKTQGCGYNVFEALCLDALSTEECSAFNGKGTKCRKNGCVFKDTLCMGRWD